MTSLSIFVVGAGVLLLGQSPQDPAAPREPSTPTFRSSVEAVQVTAIVTDANGDPVSGLTADDFEVLENGVVQPITTFLAVDVPIERVERTAVESDVLGNDGPPGRVYLIALDDMSAENALRTRFFLRQFIDTYFGPNDSAAIVLTTRGLRTDGQDFTSNPRLLLNAIDKFSGGSSDGDSLRAKNIFGSLKDLTEIMAKVPGRRKAIIFVSQGLGNPDMCGCDAYRLIGYKPGPLGGVFSDINRDFHSAVSAATRGNVAIYPVDPGGLTTDLPDLAGGQTAFTEQRSQLDALAEVTGGFALTGSNNYRGAFERLVRENSIYYLLGFNSAVDNRDGRYVSVEVRTRQQGLQVRAPEGYLAPRGRPSPPRAPETVLTAVWDAVASPLTTSGVPMRVFATPFKGRGKNATVAVALEISPSKLNLVEADGAYRGQLEIVLAVTDAKKKRWPLMRHRWGLALKPATYERVSEGALRVLSELSLPEGRYQLRVSAGGAVLAGSVVYDVEVPDFSDDFALSGLALASERTAGTFTVSSHARLGVALPAAPTTAREFSSDDTLVLFAEVYENRRKPHAITFTSELLDSAGAVIATDSARRDATTKPAEPSAYVFTPRLVLDELPPGRYTVRVEARSSLDPGKPLERAIPFTVRHAP